MSYGQSTAPRPSPFSERPDQDFFHANPQHREALATLLYGIEARKGLILFTGDAGTGKSTLLLELTRALSASVSCTHIVDPHLSFAEILRCMLRQLQIEPESADEPALFRQCLTLLRSQRETERIIAVAFDDAHHMRETVIERVLRNFVVTDPNGTRSYLAQVVLAGRPELKERFLRPPLRSATTPVALECLLAPLADKEIGEYIQFRMSHAGLPVDLFDAVAMQRIAHYSAGKLRLVNSLCDRAFQATDRSIRRHIGVDMIENVAKDLDLWQPRWVRKDEPKMDFVMPQGRDDDFQYPRADEDTTESVGQTFLQLSGVNDRKHRFGSRGGWGRFVGVLLAAVFLAVPGLWLYGELAKHSSSDWSVMLGEVAGKSRQIFAQAENIFLAQHEDVKPPDAVASVPASESFPLTIEDPATSVTPPPKIAELLPPPEIAVDKDKPEFEEEVKSPPRAIARAKQIPQEFSDRPKKDLANQISKAIENRAIAGVRVTVKDDIAYLDGRVATERQRRAAERAARDIGDLRGISNRITIE